MHVPLLLTYDPACYLALVCSAWHARQYVCPLLLMLLLLLKVWLQFRLPLDVIRWGSAPYWAGRRGHPMAVPPIDLQPGWSPDYKGHWMGPMNIAGEAGGSI